MSRGISRLTVSAVSSCVAFVAAVAARAAGAPPHPSAAIALGAAAVVLAAAVAVRTIASAWRGPVLVAFSPDAGVICDPREAQRIRAAALLRGTMGGAGYVSRARLAFPAVAWAAAAATTAALHLAPSLAPWLVAVLASSAGAALMFPARPFYYREAVGGRIVLHPPAVREDLARNRVSAHLTR